MMPPAKHINILATQHESGCFLENICDPKTIVHNVNSLLAITIIYNYYTGTATYTMLQKMANINTFGI